MFNHNFIHKFQPRANGARAVVEAVDMDAFASALRGSFARGGRGGRGASTRFRSTRSDDCWSGAERSKTKRGCVNAGLLQSIGAVRARGEFDTEVASTGVEFERARWMNHLDFRAESTFCDFARLALGLLGVGGLRFCPATDVLSMSRLAARRLSSSS
jgi:hypothetical protein